jgi:hypothetical protein
VRCKNEKTSQSLPREVKERKREHHTVGCEGGCLSRTISDAWRGCGGHESLWSKFMYPDSWHMTLRLGNLRSESRGPTVLSPFPLDIVRNMTSGRSVSPRIVVEQKVFRTMERCCCAASDARRALCLCNRLTPHSSPTAHAHALMFK